MSKEQEDIAYFISFCIEIYKNANRLSGKEAMHVLEEYGVLEYLEECYEVLHTQGHHWILADIDEFINLRKAEKEK